MNQQSKMLRKLILSALFAALTCITTMFVKVPLPAGGYVHLGNTFVFLSGWILGPFYGAAAAGIGSLLADVLSGYAQYAIFTLIIKALMAMAAYGCLRLLKQKPLLGNIIGGIIATIILAIGYFICDWFFYGSVAIIHFFMYLLEGAVAIVVSLVFLPVFQRIGWTVNMDSHKQKSSSD